MKEHVFESAQRVAAPLDAVFAFFSNPANLSQLTPPAMRFRLLGATEGPIRKGSRFTYSMRVAGIPLRWFARITQWNPPHDFEDEQVTGPCRSWIHRHAFSAIDGEQTEIRDHVRYTMPLQPFGEIGAPVAAATIRSAFRYRRRALARTFPGQDS